MDKKPKPELQIVKSAKLRFLLISLGTFFVVVGVIGVFLPVMPTTPFLLLAAACYARASEKHYEWLVSNRYYGPYIRQWRETGSVPPHAKPAAITLIVVTMGTSIVFFIPNMTAKIIMACIGLLVILFLLRIPTRPPNK